MSLFQLPVVSREKVTIISKKKSRVKLYSPDPTSPPSHRKPVGRLGNPHFFESLFWHSCREGERDSCLHQSWWWTEPVGAIDNLEFEVSSPHSSVQEDCYNERLYELSSQEKTWRKLKCLLVSEWSQSEKAATVWFQLFGILEKTK